MFTTSFLFFLPLLLIYAVLAIYAERKISAFIQDRMGPMEVGYNGLLQTVADLLKLIQKEDIVPQAADRRMFLTAPVIIFTVIFAGFAVLPVSAAFTGASIEAGAFYILAIISLDVIAVLMAGWGSNSKYAIFGAFRSVAQLISYEIPMGLSVLCVVMICQSLNLQEISYQQGIFFNHWNDLENTTTQYLFGLKALNIDVSGIGGFVTWNIFRSPVLLLVYIIFFIAALAESNRAPFDLPESESELVGGYHVEYSGFRWSLIMLSEYAMLLLLSILGVVLFLGSWNTPFPNIGVVKLAEWTSGTPGTWTGYAWGVFWLLSKSFLIVLIKMWIRWTYPRLRVDQLMSLCWKYLIPASLILVFLCGIWRLGMI